MNGKRGSNGSRVVTGAEDRSDKYMNFEEFRQSHNKLAHSYGSGRSSGYGQNSSSSKYHHDLSGGGSSYERGRGTRKGGSNLSRYRW